jgi:hypothetical protein
MPRAIDCWVNANMGDAAPRDGVIDRFLHENANQLFFQKGTS